MKAERLRLKRRVPYPRPWATLSVDGDASVTTLRWWPLTVWVVSAIGVTSRSASGQDVVDTTRVRVAIEALRIDEYSGMAGAVVEMLGRADWDPRLVREAKEGFRSMILDEEVSSYARGRAVTGLDLARHWKHPLFSVSELTALYGQVSDLDVRRNLLNHIAAYEDGAAYAHLRRVVQGAVPPATRAVRSNDPGLDEMIRAVGLLENTERGRRILEDLVSDPRVDPRIRGIINHRNPPGG